MKTAETKSAAQQHNTEAQSFLNQGQEQEQAFFSEHASDRDSFFPSVTPTPIQLKSIAKETPFFTPASVPVQPQCATCEAEEKATAKDSMVEPPTVQRTPAVDSAGTIQAKAEAFGVAVAQKIAPPPAKPKQQRTPGSKELEQEEGAATETPQIQMMPAFSSAEDSGGGEDGNADQPPVQFRLTIGQPGDAYEREADAMADRVAARSRERAAAKPFTVAQPPQVSRKPESGIKRSDAPVDWLAALKQGVWGTDAKPLTPAQPQQVSRKPNSLMMQSDGKPSIAPKPLESHLQQANGSGTPLDTETRSEMEDAFSSDFSGVQIHSGQEATSLNQSLDARAFTHKNNIFFNKGEYQPQSTQGKHLLAHELTHTIQQGHGVQQKVADSPFIQASQTTPDLQRVPDAAGNQPTGSSEVVDLTTSPFKPSDKVKGEIEAKADKGLDVRTIIKGVTSEGRVKVKLDRQGNYDSIGKGSMPLLNDWAKQLGGMYVNFSIKNNEITGGYASLKEKGGGTNDWLQALKKNASVLGGLGLKVENLPTPVNKLENGKLTLGVNDLKVEVGGFVDAQFNLLLENANKPKIDAIANINVKGVAKGTLKLDNTQEKLTGEVGLGIDLKAFSGEAKVIYKGDGTVDISGKAVYNANKLSGEIQFVSTDLETANKFAKDAIAAAGGKENVQDAPPPAPVPLAKSGSKERALAATGQLGFNLTTWFAGTVNVVVDGKGDITVIGKIAPPAEIELFKQRDWEKEIVTFEARAYYGIPLVGNLNVFANIGLHALAKLGPAKIYNIEILGTYSTDPDIQKSIQISGSLNISAYAGLRLRAEGGAGIELVGHDLRFGVGLNADVGVKAYADARPTIGYRDPGVFYVSGTLELVAQPMLGLGGDFFIELDSPWWSPAPDKKWIWPLFSKEWPLSDPIGISATLKDYELGSGKVPEVELKKPEFDPSKFMTNMVDNNLPDKSGGKDAGQGTFKEDGSVPKPTIAPKQPEPKKADTKPSKKGTPLPTGKSANPESKAENAKSSMKLLADAAKQTTSLKAKAPLVQADLTKELAKIKGQVSGVDFSVKPKDEKWAITPKAGDKAGKPFEVGAKDLGNDEETDKSKEVRAGIAQDLRGKTVKDFAQEEALFNSIYEKYRPKGLKSIKFDKRSTNIGVIVSASLAQEVAQLDLSLPDNRRRLLEIIKRIHYLAPGATWIFAYYNGQKVAEVKNQNGRHAETVFINEHLTDFRERIINDINSGKLEKEGAVNIHWDMSRSPCVSCAEFRVNDMVSRLKQGNSLLGNLQVNLTINASAVEGKTGIEGLQELLDPERLDRVGIKATDIWSVIENKLKQNYQFYTEDNPELIYYVRQFGDFRSKALDLQAEIDGIVEAQKKKPKDLSKS